MIFQSKVGTRKLQWFKNAFPFDYGVLYLNITPVPIYESHHSNKRSLYTSDLLPCDMSVAYPNYFSTLYAHFYSPRIHFPASDYSETDNFIMRDEYDFDSLKKATALGAMIE